MAAVERAGRYRLRAAFMGRCGGDWRVDEGQDDGQYAYARTG